MVENDHIISLFLLVVDDHLLAAFPKRFDDFGCLGPSSTLCMAGECSPVAQFHVDPLPSEPSEKDFRMDQSAGLIPQVIGPKESHALGLVEKGEDFLPVSKPVSGSSVAASSAPLAGHRFFWGWVAYRDVLPGTKRHLTEFCRELRFVGYRSSNQNLSLNFNSCQHHNCTDESCEDYEEMLTMVP